MFRTMVGAAVGMAVGMLLVAAWGGHYGYENGLPSANLPPGLQAAAIDALWACIYLFWIALPAGAVIGGLAGFGSWLVRPRTKVKRQPVLMAW